MPRKNGAFKYTIKFTIHDGYNNNPITLLRDDPFLQEKVLRKLDMAEIFIIDSPIVKRDGSLIVLVYCFYNRIELQKQLDILFDDNLLTHGTLYYAVA